MAALNQSQMHSFKQRIPSAVETESMAKHTTFHIGGPAKLYVVAPTSERLLEAVQAAAELEIPFFVFGGGSNLLVSDEGFDGLVIQAANQGFKVDEEYVDIESGLLTVLAARKSVEAGLTGFEWAVGLPGTVGGAVYGNAGCYGGEMKDVVVRVDAYRLADQKKIEWRLEDCHFEYRDSLFKHEPHVILGCRLKLERSKDIAPSKARLEEIMSTRKAQQPIGSLSAGCIFKNAAVTPEDVSALEAKGYSPMFGHDSKQHVSAGWLVEQAGMKGEKIGNVQVSEKHGNFFLIQGTARAQDVVALISLVKMKVRDQLGIELHEEVQYLGF